MTPTILPISRKIESKRCEMRVQIIRARTLADKNIGGVAFANERDSSRVFGARSIGKSQKKRRGCMFV